MAGSSWSACSTSLPKSMSTIFPSEHSRQIWMQIRENLITVSEMMMKAAIIKPGKRKGETLKLINYFISDSASEGSNSEAEEKRSKLEANWMKDADDLKPHLKKVEDLKNLNIRIKTADGSRETKTQANGRLLKLWVSCLHWKACLA